MGCLGLEILGNCSYDRLAPAWRIISLGDTIATIALIITFTQLLTPTLKAKIEGKFGVIYILWALSVIFISVSSILPLFPNFAVPIVSYPIFWEFLGSILIISSIIRALFIFNRPLKFDLKTNTNIKNLCSRIIATGDEKDLAELAIKLRKILKDLVEKANSYNSIERSISQKEGRKYIPPQLSLEAGEILRICSDEEFCSTIVRKEPEFAIVFFDEIRAQRAYQNHFVTPLVRELNRQAILNQNSIFNRERKYKGLGFIREYTDAALRDAEFNDHIYPLALIRLQEEKNVSVDVIDSFGEAINVLVESYIKANDFYSISLAINTPVNQLLEYASRISYQIDKYAPDEVVKSEDYAILQSICFSIGSAIECMASDNNLLNADLIQHYSKMGVQDTYSPYEMTASWIYKLMEAFSHTRKYDRHLGDLFFDIWSKAYRITKDHESEYNIEVQKRLKEKIFSQLKVNLEQGFYPAISRPLIMVLGLDENPKNKSEDIIRKEFFDYLKLNYPSLYNSDTEKALDKLPIGVEYDSEKKIFTQYIRKGQSRSIKI